MMKPTVHLNGTSGEALLEQITDASNAISTAIDGLANASPNARDYYVTPGTWEPACAWIGEKLAQLRVMRAELALTAEHIQKQVDARRQRLGGGG